jgi:diguanylate cyclase (GGDEF)-like protein
MLQEFGVEVTSCANLARVPLAIEGGNFDALIVDEPALQNDAQLLTQWKHASYQPLPILLLRNEHAGLDQEEAFNSGADDFLRKPMSPGELLARLRVAARMAEFERRCESQSWEDPITGLPCLPALESRLEKELQSSAPELALLTLELDCGSSWQRSHGETHYRQLLRAVAAAIDVLGAPAQFACRGEGHQFVIVLPAHSLAAAAKVAERLRQSLQQLGSPTQETLTASLGIAVRSAQDTAAALLARSREALQDAQRAGCDCIATYGQYDEVRRTWAQQVNGGNPFATSMARDVMTPFVIELSSTDTLGFAEALLAQMQLPFLPVVDARGRCQGLVHAEEVGEALQASAPATQPVEQLAETGVPQIAESTSFAPVI